MTNPCDGCPHHEAHEHRLRAHTEAVKEAEKRLDTVDRCLERLTLIEEQNARALAGVKSDVDELKGRPARQWGAVQQTALTVLVTTVVTVALSQFGIGG